MLGYEVHLTLSEDRLQPKPKKSLNLLEREDRLAQNYQSIWCQYLPLTRCMSAIFGVFYEKGSLNFITRKHRNSTTKVMKRYE